MSVYNDAQFLLGAVKSILAQSFRDFEFIVVNDGSSDSTQSILDSVNDSRLIVVRKEHQGLAKALNSALSIARGSYIARQDADDISLPQRLAKQVAYLNAHDDIALVGTGVTLIDDFGKRLRDRIYPPDHVSLRRWLDDILNPLPHTTVMFRLGPVMRLGGYDEWFPTAEDYALFLRLIESHHVASIPEPLVLLRYRVDSMTFSDGRAQLLKYALLARVLAEVRRRCATHLSPTSAVWPDFMQRFEGWFEASGIPRRFMAGRHRRAAEVRLRQRDYANGVKLLWHSIKDDPEWLLRLVTRRRHGFWGRSIEQQVMGLLEGITS